MSCAAVKMGCCQLSSLKKFEGGKLSRMLSDGGNMLISASRQAETVVACRLAERAQASRLKKSIEVEFNDL